MATTSDIKNKLCLEHNGQLYMVISFQHVKPGKGNAFVRTKLRNLVNGKVVDHTFPAGHKIKDIRVERRTFQYLYNSDMTYHFMNTKTYEQIELQEDFIPSYQLLKEGDNVDVLIHAGNETPLSCELPQNVILEVTYTEPGIKGDTATNAFKPATVETGAEVKVPLFINTGDVIKVDTTTFRYVERVKK